jgi:hypothetical protein
MLGGAVSAFMRVFDALWLAAWCAADPGPMAFRNERIGPGSANGSRKCAPDDRLSSATAMHRRESAAPRPEHDSETQVVCEIASVWIWFAGSIFIDRCKKYLTRRANHLHIFTIATSLSPRREAGGGLFQFGGGSHSQRQLVLKPHADAPDQFAPGPRAGQE